MSTNGKRYFCNEPWLGVLGIEVNRDVTFCPCYMKLRLGNIDEQSLEELWNSPELVEIRDEFRHGRLPRPCQGQVCPPAVGVDSHLSHVPELSELEESIDPLPGPA